MNDINLSNCKIVEIKDSGKYKLLLCQTKIMSETQVLINANVQVFVEKELFDKKNNTDNTKNIMAVGKSCSFTGKTVIDINGANINISLLVQNIRRIDYARNDYESTVKLMDVCIDDIITVFNSKTGRNELVCKYYNSDIKNNAREIIVSINNNKISTVKKNSSYNLSGNLVIRNSGKKLLAVIYAKTFIKDFVLKAEDVCFHEN